MPTVTDYGSAYLDTASFRIRAALFGVGMAMRDYSIDAGGDAKLDFVLHAARCAIDAFCADRAKKIKTKDQIKNRRQKKT